MLDVRSLMILSTAAILTVMVASMALMNMGSVAGAHGRILQVFSHRVIIVELSVNGPVWLTKVEVNGVTAWKGKLAVTPSNPVLLIESIGCVKTFHTVHEAEVFATRKPLMFPGRPLPNTNIYLVKLYFSDGSVVVLNLRAPS